MEISIIVISDSGLQLLKKVILNKYIYIFVYIYIYTHTHMYIFSAVANNALNGSKLLIFLLCQKMIRILVKDHIP